MKNLISKHIYITSLMGLAFCCVTFFPQIIDCKENTSSISRESQQHEWERLVETILLLRNKGKLNEAVAAGEKVKEDIERRGDVDSLKYTKILKILGSVYIGLRNYTLAEPLLKKALLLEEKIGAQSGCIAESQHLIGYIYGHERQDQEAEKWLKMAASNFAKDTDSDVYNFAACLTDLASLTASYKKNYKEAALLYQKAHDILKKISPEKRALQETVLLCNESSLYLTLQDYKRVKMLLDQAVNIMEKYDLLSNPWASEAYLEFGNYFTSIKEYSKGLQYYQKALTVITSLWGESAPHCARIYAVIAGNYSRQKEYSKAIKYEIKALNINNKYYGKDSVDNVSRLTYLSYLYFMNGNQADALKASDDVFNLCERLGWRESDVFLLTLTTRAEIFRRLGREKDAAAVEAILHNKYNWK